MASKDTLLARNGPAGTLIARKPTARARYYVGAVLILLMAGTAGGQPERKQKKPRKSDEKEPITQTLPALPDPPPAVAAETAKLVFHVSPLSNKGLLSQQVRDALKALDRDNRGAQVVKLRAFVAGTGDMRRVQQIVSEVFTDRKQPLPALTTVQVGTLPLEGAQVVIESVSAEKRAVNSGGLVFLPPQSLEELKEARDILRITCFSTRFDEIARIRGQVAAAFPTAAADFVQLTRFGGDAMTSCEAVARAGPSARGVIFTSPKVVFSGLQMAFRDDEADIRLAFDRLNRAIEPLGGRAGGAFVSVYAIHRSAGETASRLRGGAPLLMPMLMIEGLPSLDATVGIEMVASASN